MSGTVSIRRLAPDRVPRAACPPVSGALLLEVVVALTLMVMAMGLLGAQLVGGLRMVTYAEEQTRATQLADRLLALLELDPNTVERFLAEREIDGDFGEQYPGWFWRAFSEDFEEVAGEEIEAEELVGKFGRVTIEILHQSDPDRVDDVEDALVVRRLHMLKAARGTIDLERDFGMPAEQAETLKASLPPDVLTEEGEIDIARLVQYTNVEDLFALLPMFMNLMQQSGALEQFGGGMSGEELANLINGGGISPDELAGLIGGMDPGGGGEGGIDAIAELLQSQLGGQLSEEELNALLSNIGQGGGGSGFGGERGGRRGGGEGGGRPGGERGGGRGDEERQGRGIEDIDRDREGRNLRRGGQ